MTKDPELRTTTTGKTLCSFNIAFNRYYKQSTGAVVEETSYFDITSWSKLAEVCSAMGHKGRGVKVVGSLTQDRWTDPEGKPRSKIKILAEHVEFRPDFSRGTPVRDTTPAEADASVEDMAMAVF